VWELPSPEAIVSWTARNAGTVTTGGLSLPPDRIVYDAGTRTFVEPPAEREPLDPREVPYPAPPAVLVPEPGAADDADDADDAEPVEPAEPDEPPPFPDCEDDAVAAVVLDVVVVSVDDAVAAVDEALVDDERVDPPHAPSRSASGNTIRNRLRGLTVCSIDADLLS
jgi:hypothetical protein